ncbi:MAG: response regulator transcription factor [Pseudomonas sp.]|uniref:response regulator n=1 Tax=Pseudomonas sp. TaxID=306 RepID=UPI003BB516F9
MGKILIADDHAVVRMALRLVLEKAGHEIIGEAASGVDVIALARTLSPDLIVLDIDMPQLDGLHVLQRLCHGGGGFKVLVFSGLQVDRYSVRCSRAGASAFVCKDGDMTELLTAVQVVLAGYTLFPVTDSSSVDVSTRLVLEEDILKSLSARELTVLRYLARGYRIKDIAQEMLLSEKTASTYKARLVVKLQVSNQVELVELAKRNGLA